MYNDFTYVSSNYMYIYINHSKEILKKISVVSSNDINITSPFHNLTTELPQLMQYLWYKYKRNKINRGTFEILWTFQLHC